MRRDLQSFGHAKPPNDKLVNVQSSDSRAANCQSPNGYRAESQRAERRGTHRTRTK
jgi:hypothetical protein